MAIGSALWLVGLGLVTLTVAVVRTVWFLVWPPCQVRWMTQTGPIEVMAVSAFGRHRESGNKLSNLSRT